MVKQKIFITGGNGYIGSRLAYFLAKKGNDVIPVCNSSIPEDQEWRKVMFEIIQGDIRLDKTLETISGLKPDTIIHLISLDHNQSGKNIEETIDINVQSTWELLEAAKKYGVKNFIYFSTIHIYGNNNHGIVTEDTLPRPVNSYALTHLMSEHIVNYYNSTTAINALNVRLSNSYGEPQLSSVDCWDLVINDLCKTAYLEKQIVLKSDGLSSRDFIHYSTICNYIESLIDLESNLQENTFNLCSGNSMHLLDLALKIKEVYRMRYNEVLAVYVNTNELVTSEISEINCLNFISNIRIKGMFPNHDFPIELGINLVFEYLENNNKK